MPPRNLPDRYFANETEALPEKNNYDADSRDNRYGSRSAQGPDDHPLLEVPKATAPRKTATGSFGNQTPGSSRSIGRYFGCGIGQLGQILSPESQGRIRF